jgi:signal transduction histidine kinase
MRAKVLRINDLLLDNHTRLRNLLGDGIELVTRMADDLGSIHAMPDGILRVIVALTENAKDAMPCGGRLTIRTGNAEIGEGHPDFDEMTAPGRYVLLEVSDNGRGMTEETLAHAFDPFFTTQPGTHAGLGLALVDGIVLNHGGFIRADSRPGEGTAVRIYFPRSSVGTGRV